MFSLKDSLSRFRAVALLEGVSFILLLFVAMPLKYVAGMPEAVKLVGWAHGALFVAYLFALIDVWQDRAWSFGRVVLAFAMSLIPFGTFYLDKKLRAETV